MVMEQLQVKTFVSVLQPLQLHKAMQEWLDVDPKERTEGDDAFTGSSAEEYNGVSTNKLASNYRVQLLSHVLSAHEGVMSQRTSCRASEDDASNHELAWDG